VVDPQIFREFVSPDLPTCDNLRDHAGHFALRQTSHHRQLRRLSSDDPILVILQDEDQQIVDRCGTKSEQGGSP
jgi:hypothetical protein